MSLTLLQIVQDASTLVGLDKPTSIIGSTHPTAVKALAMLHLEGANLRRDYSWDVLKRQHTITLQEGVQTYPLPADFERHVFSTAWDNRQLLPVSGPQTSQDWQFLNNSNFVYTTSKAMRCWTWLNNQVFLYSIPDSTDAGSTITFEYFSRTWIRYQLWRPSASYTINDRVWWNGNRYTSASTATSGSTPPTHTTGTVSDGVVNWIYRDPNTFSDVQERFEYNTDVPLLDGPVLQMMLQAALYDDMGQVEQAGTQRARAQKLASQCSTNLKGISTISLTDLKTSETDEGVYVSSY